jgi:hypothetical protein
MIGCSMMMRREHENDAKHVKRTASSASPTKKMYSTKAATAELNTTLNKMNFHATIMLHCCKPYLVQAVLVGWASIDPQTCFANTVSRFGSDKGGPQCHNVMRIEIKNINGHRNHVQCT